MHKNVLNYVMVMMNIQYSRLMSVQTSPESSFA